MVSIPRLSTRKKILVQKGPIYRENIEKLFSLTNVTRCNITDPATSFVENVPEEGNKL